MKDLYMFHEVDCGAFCNQLNKLSKLSRSSLHNLPRPLQKAKWFWRLTAEYISCCQGNILQRIPFSLSIVLGHVTRSDHTEAAVADFYSQIVSFIGIF